MLLALLAHIMATETAKSLKVQGHALRAQLVSLKHKMELLRHVSHVRQASRSVWKDNRTVKTVLLANTSHARATTLV